MPENPLLPDASLRALLALTKRVATLETSAARRAPRGKGSPSASGGREAALAATTLQLKVGDLLIPEVGDGVALALAPKRTDTPEAPAPLLPATYTQGASRLLLASTMAAALKAAGTDHVVLVFARAGKAEPGWPAALTWAQEHLLPLLVVCLDASGPAAFTVAARPKPEAFVWSTVARAATRSKLPVLTVDGEDAVAMYRATQEALLRARAGGGPALLWAALPTSAQKVTRSRSDRPLVRLAQYLRARHIPLS